MTAMPITIAVVISVSLREGQVTLETSLRTSRRNPAGSKLTVTTPARKSSSTRTPILNYLETAAPAGWFRVRPVQKCPMAGVEGLELSTSGFGDRRSSQLSYTPASSVSDATHIFAPRLSSPAIHNGSERDGDETSM